MNINKLTIGEAREIATLFQSQTSHGDLQFGIGEKCIIRTCSSGVWFGTLEQKCNNEIVLKDARRLCCWQASESISLSAVAKYGVRQSDCKFAPAVDQIWLEAIEIIPCSTVAIDLIEGCEDASAT